MNRYPSSSLWNVFELRGVACSCILALPRVTTAIVIAYRGKRNFASSAFIRRPSRSSLVKQRYVDRGKPKTIFLLLLVLNKYSRMYLYICIYIVIVRDVEKTFPELCFQSEILSSRWCESSIKYLNFLLFFRELDRTIVVVNWERLYLFVHERYICVGNSLGFVVCKSKSIRTRVSSFFEIVLNL